MLRIQLNPQKVYDLLRDGSLSREDLLNFIPEDVLDALAQGRDLSLEDLKVLVSHYISPSDLSKLKELLPKEVLQDHFDLAMLEDLISVEELLSIVPIDELLNNVDDAKISALVTPAVLKLLLNEKAADAVLTDEFIENLLDESDVLDAILSNAEVKEELVKLIDDAIVDQLLANTTIKSNLLALMDRSSTLDNILADETAKTALKNYFNSKKSIVSSFLTDPEVLELLKNMPSVHDSLVTDEVIDRLISSNAINKGNIRTIFSDEQLESLINDAVLEKLLATDHFVDNFLNDDELVNKIFTPELILELKNQGLLDLSYVSDRTQLRSMLLSSAEARALVSDEIHHHPEISLAHYWEHLDFTALVNAIGIHSIQIFVDTHDDVYENILHTLGAAQIAEALGEDVCASILQNNLSDILRTVGMPKLFTYFNRDEIVSTLGGYYEILQKGYVNEEDVVAAVGGYPALMEYLPFDGIIEAIGYDRLLDFVDFNDIVASAGGYATVFSWYSLTELQAILNKIGADSLQDFLTSNGILQQLNFQQIAKDLLALLRSKGPQYKAFLQEMIDRFLLFLNTEVASIHINDTRVYYAGRFDFESIVASILSAIPDVNTFLSMNEGDALAQWILRANIRGTEYKLGISVEFIGDFSQLQDLAAEHADDFVWEVSDDLDIVSKIALPSVGAEIYEKVLLSTRVPTALKKKLLSAPTEVTLKELPDFLTDLSDEELQSIVDTVSEKIDVIRAKAYAKLDASLGGKAEKLAVAKAKVDQILNAFTSVDRIQALRDKVIGFLEGRVPAEIANKTLAELYEGNQSFRFEGTISAEYYDKALSLLQKLGLPEETAVNILVYFGNSLALEGTFDMTTTLKGIYQLTLKDSEENTHIFYLPEGIDLSIITELYPSLNVDIPDGAVMPSEDTTLSDENVWWQIDFYADGVLVKSVYYLKDDVSSLDPAEIPTVPAKLGYSGVWESYTVGGQQITRVNAVYTKITYTTTIKDETIFPEDYEVEIEYSQADRSLELPIPQKFGYTFMTWYIDSNRNNVIDEGDIRLERLVMFRMLRSAPTIATFMLPDGEIIPEGDDLALIAEFEITYYNITFVDYNGTPIPDVTLSYTPLEFDKAALTAQFPSLTLPHYTLAWYVEDVLWANYDDLALGGDVVVTSKKTPITYTVNFSIPDQTVHSTTYNVENTTLPTIAIPTPPTGYETDGEWYVVSVDGVALATPVKLSEYTVEGGDLEIKAFYTAIKYTATFYKEDGSILIELPFTVEDTAIAGAPDVPAKLGYTGAWDSYTIGAGDLHIRPNYTAIVYTVTFKYADGSTLEKTYTVEDYSLFANLPTVPDRAGYKDGAWYVADVKIDEFTPTTGDLTIEAKYTAIEYIATFKDHAGNVVGTAKFTVEGFIDTTPNVPDRIGYTGVWNLPSQLPAENIDVIPTYTTITYTATFYDKDGNVIQRLPFTVEDIEIAGKPDVPARKGYTGVWENYEIGAQDLHIDPIYTATEYTILFKDKNGTTIGTITYTVTSLPDFTTILLPEIPDLTTSGYENDGIWYVGNTSLTEYTITEDTLGSLTIQAKYTAIKYTATFYNKAGTVVGTAQFTVEGFIDTVPNVPDREGYKDGAWNIPSQLPAENMDVTPTYTLITYTVTFKAPGHEDQIFTYTVEDHSLFANLPAVPDRAGYTDGTWYVGDVKLSEYTVTTGDLTVEAKYTQVEYTATFKDADGNALGTAKFTIHGFIDPTALPTLPHKPGYQIVYYMITADGETKITPQETTLPAQNVEVKTVYEIITYTINVVDKDGTVLKSFTYDVTCIPELAKLQLPEIPDLTNVGYSNDGFWYVGGEKIADVTITLDTLGDITIRANYTAIKYTATFKDANGNVLGTATFTVEGFLQQKPEIPKKPGYTGAWVYPNGVQTPPNDMEVTLQYTINTYTVNFYKEDGSLLSSTTYSVETPFTIPDVPPKADYVGEWYVITPTGKVKLSEYDLAGDNLKDLEIRAIYELKKYTAYFRVDGVVIGSVTFTIEDQELKGIPTVPARRGHSAKWSAYTIAREDLYIDAIYTIIQYTATFEDEDGKTVGTVNFTINDTSIKAPSFPEKEDRTGAWYVVKVNGAKIDPVLLSEFAITDANLTIQAIYEPEEEASFAWLWWIIIILILIIIILIVLLILKKKNLPPFKRAETPPAIIAAAVPEEEEEEEEEAPVVPIVTVESVDVETADELMSDATAIAVVETVEGESSAGQKVIINLHVINDHFAAGDTVDLDALKSKKLVSAKAARVKVLADGTLDKPLTVIADGFSVQAIKMITLTGGHAVQKKSKR